MISCCLLPDKLIELIEVLVSHSISSVEMKSFLRLLGPNNEGQLPAYSHTLQELLLKMAIKSTRVFPLHYIDLSASESVSSMCLCVQCVQVCVCVFVCLVLCLQWVCVRVCTFVYACVCVHSVCSVCVVVHIVYKNLKCVQVIFCVLFYSLLVWASH